MAFRRISNNKPRRSQNGHAKANQGADHGTVERWQHSGRVLELTERAGVLAVRALEESVLDVLVLRRWISATQREAALRFKLDFQSAGLAARLSGGYNPLRATFSPFGPWDERTDAEEAAYQRWRGAIRAVGSPHSDLVVTVVCHECVPEPGRAGGLQTGLEKLARWYRLPVEPPTCENQALTK